MKTIGLLGGVTWQSTALYYKFINEEINQRLGGVNAGKILIKSVNFAEVLEIQDNDGWNRLGEFLAYEATILEKGGADFILLGANTLHKIAKIIIKEITIPLIHIVDVVAEVVGSSGFTKCGLLGTKFTMEDDFFTGKLKREYNIDTIIPEPEERNFIHKIIYEEISIGIVSKKTQQRMIAIISKLKESGAEAIILGCTELGMLINEDNSPLHPIDTAKIHTQKAVELALE